MMTRSKVFGSLSLSFLLLLLLRFPSSCRGQFNPYRDVCGSLCSCENQILNCSCWWGARTNFVLTGDVRARNFHTLIVEHCGKVELDLVNPTYGIQSDLIYQNLRRFVFRNLSELSIYGRSLESTNFEELTISDVASLIADNSSIVNNGSKPHHVQRVILRNVTSLSISSFFLNVTSLEALILDGCHFGSLERFAFRTGKLTSLLISNSLLGNLQARAFDVESHVSDVTLKRNYFELTSGGALAFKSITRLTIKDNRFEEMATGSVSVPLGVSHFRFTGNRISYVEENPFWPFHIFDSLQFSRNYFRSAKAGLLPLPVPLDSNVEDNMFGNCDRREALHLRHLASQLANRSACLFEDGTTIAILDFFAEEMSSAEDAKSDGIIPTPREGSEDHFEDDLPLRKDKGGEGTRNGGQSNFRFPFWTLAAAGLVLPYFHLP